MLFLEKEGYRYAPDLVVLALFLGNDPENNASSRQYGLDKPILLGEEFANVPVPKPGSDAPEIVAAEDPIELTARLIERMSRSSPALLVVMKFGAFIDPASERFREQQSRLVERLGQPTLAYFDLDHAFERAGVSISRMLRGNQDGHWNAYGHRRTAELLREYLADHQLLE